MTAPTDQWWVINGDVMLDAIRRAHAGEDPDLLYVELIANSTIDDSVIADEEGE